MHEKSQVYLTEINYTKEPTSKQQEEKLNI